jgi:hypothetical protein
LVEQKFEAFCAKFLNFFSIIADENHTDMQATAHPKLLEADNLIVDQEGRPPLKSFRPAQKLNHQLL